MFLLSALSQGLSGSGATDRYWVTDINRTELKGRTPPTLGFVLVNRLRDELEAVKPSAMTALAKVYEGNLNSEYKVSSNNRVRALIYQVS